MARLRVWVVTPELHRLGGTERSVAEQLERWRERFELSLYTMRTEGTHLGGIRVRRLWSPPGPYLPRYVWWLVANHLVRWWDRRRFGAPDVVYSPGINCFDAHAIGIHVVFSKLRLDWSLRVRGSARRLHRVLVRALLRRFEQRVYSGPATLWAVSQQDAAAIEAEFGRPACSVPVVPQGVDAQEFSPAARRALRSDARQALGVEHLTVALLVGNDWRNKGLATAIRTLKGLPKAYAVAAAGRDDPAPFREVARSAGVADRVFFWPHSADILRYYAAADCLVAPSHWDAFHMPALEAMSCGLPVVLSSKAGVAELVEDGRHALLLRDPEDSGALARLIRRIFEEPGTAERLVREGRALAERCSWDVNADRAAALIEPEAATPRVLVLAADAWGTGGIERATRTLLRALADLYGAERVGLLSVWGPVEGRPLPCRVLRAHRGRPGEGRAQLVSLGRKLGVVRTALAASRRWCGGTTVIVACHPHLAPLAWTCGLVSGAPTLVWCHGFEVWGRGIRPLVSAALRHVGSVLAVSDFTAQQLRKATRVANERIHVLRHSLAPEVEPLAHADGRCPEVLTVARLDPGHPYKGVDTLIQAWPAVAARVPGARLTIVGDGADRVRLETLAARCPDTIQFAGRVSDAELQRLYARASVFCLPARASTEGVPFGEGFGLVYLEAAAAGLPVVAGRAGGATEAVIDGVTGVLVDPDSADAVAGGLTRLLRDRPLAQRMGEAGRALVRERFSYERFRDDIAQVVATLLGSRVAE